MRSEGVVLSRKLLGNGLRSLTIYTERLGKVNALVKVERGDFPLKYEPFSISLFNFKFKGDRVEVEGAALVKPLFPTDLPKLKYLFKISSLLSGLSLPQNGKLYALLKSYLEVGKDYEVAFLMFLSKLLFLEGIFPQLSRCVKCSSKDFTFFSPEEGGVLCSRCAKENKLLFSWSRESSKLLLKLTKKPFKEVSQELSTQERRDLGKLLQPLTEHLKRYS